MPTAPGRSIWRVMHSVRRYRSGLQTDNCRPLRQTRLEGKTQARQGRGWMSVRSGASGRAALPSQAKPEHRWRTRPDPKSTGVWEDEIEPLLRNDPTVVQAEGSDNYRLAGLEQPSPGGSARQLRIAATTIAGLAGAAWSGSGGVLRTRCIRAGRGGPVSDFTHCGPNSRWTDPGQPTAHQLFQRSDTQPIGNGATLRSRTAGDDLPGVAGDCRMRSGPWAAFRRYCAATIPRLPLTIAQQAAAALLTTIRRPAGHYGPAPPAQSRQSHENGVAEHVPLPLEGRQRPAPSSCGAAAILPPPGDYASFVRQWWQRRNRTS